MIWLPASDYTEEQSSYFDVRDMDIRYRNHSYSGMVSGVLGLGCTEFWAEIRIGNEPDIKILPVYHDNGEIDSVPDSVDLKALHRVLRDEIKRMLEQCFQSAGRVVPHHWQPNVAESPGDSLSAAA